MSITFANAKNGCQGSGSSTSTSAGTLSLFTSETTKGYNFYKNKSASNGKWEVAVFGRAHNYSSSAETYDYTIYVFARKLNSATSHGDFKITFYYRDKSYSVTSSRYIQSKTGKVRLIASHTFDGLNCEPSGSTTIGAKVVGPSGTEAAGTITATDTADFSGGASWSVYVQSDSSIKLEGTKLTTNRGFRHSWVWQWKRTSASSYTTDATTNAGADNSSTSLSHTFTGLVRNTSYDVRARFYLRNYDPTDSTYNDPVPISSRTIVRTATTDKSDLSGSVSLSGNRYVGGTLTANVTNTDNANVAYQWCYNTTNSGSGAVISGATSSTYTVTSDYVGKYIYCKVTFSKTDFNNLVIRKYTSDVVYKRSITGNTTISGATTYGEVLSAEFNGVSTGAQTYQWWYSNNSNGNPQIKIDGATSKTYTIGSGLVGKYIGCTVVVAESDIYIAGIFPGITSSAVVKASNPAKYPAYQNAFAVFSTNSQNKSFIAVTSTVGSVSYYISNQKNSSGVAVDYFSIPTNTNNSITIAAETPVDKYTLEIGFNVSGNADYAPLTERITYTLTINKASGSGSVTMNGWTYGGTVTNPTPSSSTNGTSNVSYTWYDSNKTQLSAKPTSTSNAGTYYVKATFAATTNYNEYTTDYVSFTIARATPTLSLNPSSLSLIVGQSKTSTITTNNSSGTLSISGDSYTTSSLEGNIITVVGKAVGNSSITVTLSQTTNYNSATVTLSVTVTQSSIEAVAPTITILQDYLKGDYGVNAATVSYEVSGGTGIFKSIIINSGDITIVNSTSSSGSVHAINLSTSLGYTVVYQDTYGNTDTKTGTISVSYPYNKNFNYTYAYKNASGVNQAGTSKTFTNDGQKATQYCLTASEWNEMLKFLYSAAYRKNGWSSTGLSAPTMVSSNSHFTKAIYNSALVLLNKLVSTSYSNVVSKERITAEHLNRFRTHINNNR